MLLGLLAVIRLGGWLLFGRLAVVRLVDDVWLSGRCYAYWLLLS